MKGRGIRFIAAGLLLMVVLTALWVWPQKLGRDQIPDVFRIQHTHSFMRLIDKESFFSVPDGTITYIYVERESEAYEKALEILESLRYFRCAHTVLGERVTGEEELLVTWTEEDGESFDLLVFTDTAHIMIDKTAYRLAAPQDLYEMLYALVQQDKA